MQMQWPRASIRAIIFAIVENPMRGPFQIIILAIANTPHEGAETEGPKTKRYRYQKE